MAFNSSSAGRAGRPTVRIVEPRVNWRAALVTLGLTALTGALLVLVWHLWRADPPIQPYQRSLAETELDWRCDGGHSFRAPGGTGSRGCAICKAPAYPLAVYACDVHGSFDVQVEFHRDADGAERIKHRRLLPVHGLWIPADENLTCPKCSRELSWVRPNPLAPAGKPKERPGG